MYRWIMRISVAAVGTVFLVLLRALEWYPVFYIFPLALILFAFMDCVGEIEDNNEERPISDDVRKVVIKPDNRRWDFSDEECYRTPQTAKEKNHKNIKIGIGVK